MQTVYRFRIWPTKEQERQMFHTLKLCRKLYNYSLNERQETYKTTGKGLSYNRQQNSLPAFVKANPEYKGVHSQVLQDVLRRLDAAYQRFFDKLAGYPRFKNRDHYSSFTYPQVNAVKKTFGKEGAIFLSKIGFVKLTAHQTFPADSIIRVNVKFHGGQWYVNLTSEIPEPISVPPIKKIGIDVGILHFAVLSDGTVIDNPKHFRKSEKKLVQLQRRLTRKNKGSNNRGKAREKVAKLHAHIANQRRDFLHKASYSIAKEYDLVVMEDLKVRNIIRNHHLAKSIQDAGWGKFRQYVGYKLERQGKKLIPVDPKGTSQNCLCGHPVPKDLSVRLHQCPKCGLTEDRDLVSAKLVLERGLRQIA